MSGKRVRGTMQEKGLKKCCRLGCTNQKTDDKGFLPVSEFWKDNNMLDRLKGQCAHCSKKINYATVHNYAKRGLELKLKAIKEQKCICPGCGFDFSICPDRALLIIFELSHVHSAKCSKRKRKGSNNYWLSTKHDPHFWACTPCNRKQKGTCGYWETVGAFKGTCV